LAASPVSAVSAAVLVLVDVSVESDLVSDVLTLDLPGIAFVQPEVWNLDLVSILDRFLDSLATLEIPAWGYGIRYDFGIFKQVIKDGYQVEIPDFWLNKGNPWEIERQDVTYEIRFYGDVHKYKDGSTDRANWTGGQTVIAMAYDTPIPGFNTYNTNNLRLWRSRPHNTFDFN
jgi:starch phosphorylase